MNESFKQKLKTSVSINYARNFTNLPSKDLTFNALSLPPNSPSLYDNAGNLSWTNWTSTAENPLAFLKRSYEAGTSNLIGNAVFSYVILANLEVKVNLGYTSTAMNGVTLIPISAISPLTFNKTNESIFSSSTFQNWVAEPQLNWKRKFGHGLFESLVGASFLDQTSQGLVQGASGFSSESLMKNIASAPTITSGTNYYIQYRYQAVFGRINYNLKDRYIINATGRRDGSSRFGPGNQFSFFGAIGAAWLFSNEDFIRNSIPFLSFGKLRGSYGTTGNDQIGDYQYLDTYQSSGNYQSKIGMAPARLSNPDFRWETNKKMEGGMDLGFLNDRIWLGVSYYRNRSTSQLVGFPLAPTTGFTSIQSNFPAKIQNAGLELVLTTRNIETNGFSWSTSLNYTIPRNRLVEFPNMAAFPAYANTYVVGQPLEISKLYHFTGIDPSTGFFTVKDFNGDGGFGVDDRQIVKFFGRNHYGGLLNTFRYKGLQLDVLLQYVNQQGYDPRHLFSSPPGYEFNQPATVMDRWRKIGDNTETQQFTQSGTGQEAYSLWQGSDQPVVDASFVRIKNLSLSYAIPNEWIRMAHFSVASLFVQCQNLLTITRYKGLNPESTSGTLPALRTITAGIHLTL
jgi:TonB-linked SusC/RagA family outer membrane protein